MNWINQGKYTCVKNIISTKHNVFQFSSVNVFDNNYTKTHTCIDYKTEHIEVYKFLIHTRMYMPLNSPQYTCQASLVTAKQYSK